MRRQQIVPPHIKLYLWVMLFGITACQAADDLPPAPPTATILATVTTFTESQTPSPPAALDPTATTPPIDTPTDVLEPTAEATATAAQSQWTTLVKMPTARSEMSVAYLDGRIYVPGGFSNNFSAEAEQAVEVYDIATDSWAVLASIPYEVNHHATAVYEGQLYLLADSNGAIALRYDPAADTWHELTPPPEPRYAGAAVSWGDYIYLVGGVGANSSNAVLRYDPQADSWTVLAAHRQAREHVAAVVYEGQIYLLGGRYDRDFNTVEIYDIATDRWRAGPSMKEKRTGFGAVVLNGRIYAAGGELLFEGRTLQTVEYFDPTTNTWQLADFELPTPLHGVPLTTDGHNLYVVGGSGRVGEVSNRGELFVITPE